MTKKSGSWGILALLLVVGLSLAGCKTIDSITGGVNTPQGDFQNITVPAKDFQSLGLVFAEASYDQDANGARGDILTFQALLKEAKALGADYIVNVVIDYKNEGSQQYVFNKPKNLVKGKVTWYGSATAIKYTETIKNSTVLFDVDGKPSTTTQSVVMNPAKSSGNSGGAASSSSSRGGLFSRIFKKK